MKRKLEEIEHEIKAPETIDDLIKWGEKLQKNDIDKLAIHIADKINEKKQKGRERYLRMMKRKN